MLVPSLEHRGLRWRDWDAVPRIEARSLFFWVIYLINHIFESNMGELRTIISANVPVSIAQRLQGKTKGTRSRVVSRALKAYLDEREAFSIEDIPTLSLLLEVGFRKELTPMQKELIRQIYLEVKQ